MKMLSYARRSVMLTALFAAQDHHSALAYSRHRRYPSRFQPLRHTNQFRRRHPVAGDFSTAPIHGRSAYPVALAPEIDPGHVPSN
jgi:hypothetical protein